MKKRGSCSPMRKRRRSQSPRGVVKEPNAHEVLKGILKRAYTKAPSSANCNMIPHEDKISKEVKKSCKGEFVPQGTKPSSRRSGSPRQRWGQERVSQSPARNPCGGSGWRRQSPSPYARSRKGSREKGSPER